MTFIIAQLIGFVATLLEIAIMQFKNMKYILVGQCISNFLIVLNYALLGGISGAAVCMVASVQTFIIYFFRKKEKEFPVILTVLFMLMYVLCSVFTYKGYNDIISGVAALLFALSVVQSKSWKYRIIILLNSVLWIIYDINTAAYTAIFTHGIAVVSVVVAMIRLDIKEWRKQKM